MKYASRVLSVFVLSLLTLTLFAGTAQARGNKLLPFTANDTLEEIRYKIANNGYSFTVADNWVTDLPPAERAKLHSRHPSLDPKRGRINDDIGPLAKYLGRKYLPATFDWRDYNGRAYIGAVRNQGTCGSCYAFGAAACAEGTFNLSLGKYLKGSADNRADFSEAFIAFCLRDKWSGFDGCSGADYDYDELSAATVQGYGNESAFPYTETDPGACTHWGIQTYIFKSWHRITCNDIDAIKTAIMTYGVVDAAINAQAAFDSYNSGCFDDDQTDCPGSPCSYTTTNHAISLVGWDDSPPEGGGGVWILRNSWGTSWGESGYMRCRFTAMRVGCAVCYLVYGAPIVNETFDSFDSGTRPSGWTFNNCNSDSDTYTASTQYGVLYPSIKLDATGDAITTASFSGSEKLSFWMRGISTTGTTDALLVEEHYGASWTTVTDINNLPTSETIAGPFYLAANTDQLRFTYSKSSSGNLAIDDIRLLGITPTPTPVGFQTPSPTPSPAGPTPTAAPPTATPTAPIATPTPPPTAPPTATPTTVIATPTPPPTVPPTATPTAVLATPTPPAGGIMEGFDNFDTGTRPDGWLFVNCNNDADTYTSTGNYGQSSPSLKLDNTGDQVSTRNFNPDSGYVLSFWLRGVSTDATSSLLVEEYTSTWTTVTDLSDISTDARTLGPFALGDSSSRVRFGYTKSAGNLAFDDVRIDSPATPTPPLATATPTPSVSIPTPTAYVPPATATPTVYVPPATPTPTAYVPPATATPTAYVPPATATPTAAIATPTAPITTPTAAIATPTVPITTPTAAIATPTAAATATPPATPNLLVVDADDYDGDGTPEIAVWRSSNGGWYINGEGTTFYGMNGDIPVPGDYDGNGTADHGIFRPGTGKWWVPAYAGGPRAAMYWGRSGDVPVPADYDGDFYTDTAVWRPSLGKWYVKSQFIVYYGKDGDVPVPGDYDGDGSADLSVFRPVLEDSSQSTGSRWYIRNISNIFFGENGDSPVPGDYNGDGTTQLSVFRSGYGRWYTYGDGFVTFGQVGDIPLAFDYEGDGTANRTIFRPSTSSWIIYQVTTVSWGQTDDKAVSGTSR